MNKRGEDSAVGCCCCECNCIVLLSAAPCAGWQRDRDTLNRSVKRRPSLVSGLHGGGVCSSSTELDSVESGVPPRPSPGKISIYGTNVILMNLITCTANSSVLGVAHER